MDYILIFLVVILLIIIALAFNDKFKSNSRENSEKKEISHFVENIEQLTLKNDNFREVVNTTDNQQLVVMKLDKGEDIGMEVHKNVDQFFRIEQGSGKVIMDDEEKPFKKDDVIMVPKGTKHNIISNNDNVVKLYTIYSPPNHPHDRIHKTKADAMKDED